MYSKSLRSFSTLRVKYFLTVATYGVITHLLKPALKGNQKRSLLASTHYKISVSFKFCKLSNGEKLEIANFYALCVSCHSPPNILRNIQTCARSKAVNNKKELGGHVVLIED